MEMVEVKETESAIKEIEGLTEGNNIFKSDHKVALTDFVNYIILTFLSGLKGLKAVQTNNILALKILET